MNKTNPTIKSTWEKRLDDCAKSGKSCKNWCKENHVGYSTFKYWKSKLKKENSEEYEFIEIKEGSQTPLNTLEVLIGPAIIRIQEGFNTKTFLQVIQLLKENS